MKTRNNAIRSRLRFLKGRDGMTITSVIVAFVVLLLAVSMFVSVVQLSQRMVLHADERRAEVFELMRRFYCGEDEELNTQKLTGDGSFELHDTNNADNTFTLDADIYEYSYNGYRLYSFGERRQPGVGAGGE